MYRELLTGHESAKKIEQNWTLFEIRAIYLDGGGHFVYVVFVLSIHTCTCTQTGMHAYALHIHFLFGNKPSK